METEARQVERKREQIIAEYFEEFLHPAVVVWVDFHADQIFGGKICEQQTALFVDLYRRLVAPILDVLDRKFRKGVNVLRQEFWRQKLHELPFLIFMLFPRGNRNGVCTQQFLYRGGIGRFDDFVLPQNYLPDIFLARHPHRRLSQ